MTMKSREELLRSPDYWFQDAQLELYKQVSDYMKREGINRTQLAERLKVSKGYITQILNGDFNYTLKKLIEVSLNIGVIPKLEFVDVDQAIQEDKTRIDKIKAGAVSIAAKIDAPILFKSDATTFLKIAYSKSGAEVAA